MKQSTNNTHLGLVMWLVTAFAVLAIPVVRLILPSSSYPSRGMCWDWDGWLVIIHDLGNAGIWVQCMIIPAMVGLLMGVTGAWRIAVTFPSLIAEGCAFVFTCGVTFLLARTEIYQATPWVSGGAIVVCLCVGIVFIVDFAYRWADLRRWMETLAYAFRRAQEGQ